MNDLISLAVVFVAILFVVLPIEGIPDKFPKLIRNTWYVASIAMQIALILCGILAVHILVVDAPKDVITTYAQCTTLLGIISIVLILHVTVKKMTRVT